MTQRGQQARAAKSRPKRKKRRRSGNKTVQGSSATRSRDWQQNSERYYGESANIETRGIRRPVGQACVSTRVAKLTDRLQRSGRFASSELSAKKLVQDFSTAASSRARHWHQRVIDLSRYFLRILSLIDGALGRIEKVAAILGGAMVWTAQAMWNCIWGFCRLVIASLNKRSVQTGYMKLLSFFHRHILDRDFDGLLFVKSQPQGKAPGLSPDQENEPRHARNYVSLRALSWAMKTLPDDLRRFRFIDLSARIGRSVLLASSRNFRQVIGVECSEELSETARLNVSHFPRSLMKCRDVALLSEVREFADLPSGPAVYFISGPDARTMCERLLKHMASHLDARTHSVYLIVQSCQAVDLVEQADLFEPVDLTICEVLVRSFLCPANIRVYKSITRSDPALDLFAELRLIQHQTQSVQAEPLEHALAA